MDEADTSAALEGLVADGGDAVRYRDRAQEVAVPKGLVWDLGDAGGQDDRAQVRPLRCALEGTLADGGNAPGQGGRGEGGPAEGPVANGGDAARQGDRDEAPAVVKCAVSDGGDAAGNIHVALRVGLVQAAVTQLARHTLRLPCTRSECEQQHGAGTREAHQDERSRASGPQSFVTGHGSAVEASVYGAWQFWNNAITNSYMCMHMHMHMHMCMSEQSINTKV